MREGAFAHVLSSRGVPVAAAVAASLTAWSAELVRAGAGGVLFLLSPSGHATGTAPLLMQRLQGRISSLHVDEEAA